MIDVFPFAGRPVAVMGLGRSGLAAADALARSGAEVRAWDDDEDRRAAARDAGLPLVDLHECAWSDLDTLVLSPGIPHTHPRPHPVAQRAREAGCEIVCDIELLARAQPEARYVGVTGTNGKSTTTALIGHVLSAAGRRIEVGGNFGPPALTLGPLDRSGTYVLEMSSYQLELTRSLVFDVAVLLNISADHLDRHGGMDGYVAAKRRIFDGQIKPQTAVIGVDDDHSRAIRVDLEKAGRQSVVPISCERRVGGGVYAVDDTLYDATEGLDDPAVELGGIPALPGAHNRQNAAAAYAAARAEGLLPARIAAGIVSYPGLPHRQELVAEIDGVRYVNDSKATNAEAAARALGCYDTVYWIAGGRPKEGGIAALSAYFPRIARAFLIGEAADGFAATLQGRVEAETCGDLATAVHAARACAAAQRRRSAVVLLSPACASFDQWPNFEARGEAFRALVEALPGTRREADRGSNEGTTQGDAA